VPPSPRDGMAAEPAAWEKSERLISVHPNPRRLRLPLAADLPTRSGKGGFLGVTYRAVLQTDWLLRGWTQPGTYRSAFDTALTRWVCMHFDHDAVGGEREGQKYRNPDCSSA
jgi:hypothetical protein